MPDQQDIENLRIATAPRSKNDDERRGKFVGGGWVVVWSNALYASVFQVQAWGSGRLVDYVQIKEQGEEDYARMIREVGII
jgi:hypothetical protein